MPRGPRLDATGVLHHVIGRGIERREIFHDDRDRVAFLARLSRLVAGSATALYAWALLPNHFHLLLRRGATSLSTLVGTMLSAYARAFNRRHHRVGYLFQGRFKSIVVEEDPYFLELVRYIHLNPVRAGIVNGLDALDSYPWTGHAGLVSQAPPPWQDTRYVLAQFDGEGGSARQRYRAFVADRVQEGRRADLAGGGLRRSRGGWLFTEQLARGRENWAFDERVLGSSDFVQRVIHEAQRPTPAKPVEPAAVMPEIIRTVAQQCALSPAELIGNCHRPAAVAARAIASYLALRRYGLTYSAVAAYLGVSRFSVARGIQRAPDLVESARALQRLLG